MTKIKKVVLMAMVLLIGVFALGCSTAVSLKKKK